MSDFKVGDIVEVSDGGNRRNFSGRGVVKGDLGCGWLDVEALDPGLGQWAGPRATPWERVSLVVDEKTDDESMLDFDSGATRNRKEDEFQYEGFLSPLALQMFAAYMHENRHTADGGVRDSDNWQKGIPDESYRDSLLRHILDLWLIYRGWDKAAREGGDLRKALAGAFFNLQGLMHNEALRGLENESGATAL